MLQVFGGGKVFTNPYEIVLQGYNRYESVMFNLVSKLSKADLNNLIKYIKSLK